MLTIKPIEKKEEQEKACALCGVPYDADCMAYSCDDDGRFIGMAQFNIDSGAGVLCNLVTLPDVDDFEALFLMGRAVLNFVDLCGIHRAVGSDRTAPERVMKAVGFVRQPDGTWAADMTHMFGGCDGKHDKGI